MPSAITSSGCSCRVSAKPSSAERAATSVTSSAPKVIAKALWIVALSSAITMRFAIEPSDTIFEKQGQTSGPCDATW